MTPPHRQRGAFTNAELKRIDDALRAGVRINDIARRFCIRPAALKKRREDLGLAVAGKSGCAL
jgi:hypothetical protein